LHTQLDSHRTVVNGGGKKTEIVVRIVAQMTRNWHIVTERGVLAPAAGTSV